MTTRPVEGALVEKVDQLGKADADVTTGVARKFAFTLRLDSFRQRTATNLGPDDASHVRDHGGER